MLRLSDFDYVLPPNAIAQQPVSPRDSARLLHCKGESLGHFKVFDLPDLLRPGDLLVVNNTKVIPARLFGKRGKMQVELLLHRRLNPLVWEAFAKPMKRLRPNEQVVFAQDFRAMVRKVLGEGLIEIGFDCAEGELSQQLRRHGHLPLPPYIKRADSSEDKEWYQTIYARHEGSIAAPTAGLHFTPELFARLEAKGIAHVAVTLHVGAGTFQTVKSEELNQHVMHAEEAALTQDVADAINATRRKGGRIVAVGTTVTRTLESAANEKGEVRAWRGETRLFITPGYRFKVVDVLFTNFHLPRSTLFMLVCAFATIQTAKNAYSAAIEAGYRFYSYGDAGLFER